MRILPLVTCITAASLLAACGGSSSSDSDSTLDNARKLLNTNAEIAYAIYSDSVDTAKALQTAINDLQVAANAYKAATSNLASAAATSDIPEFTALKNAHEAAKKAWLVAREPYGQSEVYRFRNSPIDSTDYSSEDGPEGAINAWPLGEALIDYVEIGGDFDNGQIDAATTLEGVGISTTVTMEGEERTLNVINAAHAQSNQHDNIIGRLEIDIEADENDDGLADILEASEAGDGRDVISGYHAIEFMLWGQDLKNNGDVTNGTDRDEAVKTQGAANLASGGQRGSYDFVEPTYGDRRLAFLKVVTAKLVADLESVQAGWAPGASYRTSFTSVSNEAAAKGKITEILTGMATLSQGELAGERMQIAFADNSQEDEHSCFSDNTHRDIWLNAEGVSNSFHGQYAGYDSDLNGTDDVTTRAVNGYGLNDFLTDEGKSALASELSALLATTEVAYKSIDTKARAGEPVDVQIMEGNNNTDTPMANTILALTAQANKIAEVATQLDINDPVLDPDGTACDTANPTSTCD
ncbi:peptidase, imelysin family protein [Thalassolituus sp. ST750PaO-4]|uniref:imelysin family protein n=1 Tax=Thalassolituus sp. ST750PaO-4 TaxID=2742965 RepID=UPI001CE24BF4|nr:imelysin family protein [Thalassolituus sp. ST750PaO-4]MCA6060178.1 peptidase, imelysin family protein [Thalassolituus sp. ST750PaO-4]